MILVQHTAEIVFITLAARRRLNTSIVQYMYREEAMLAQLHGLVDGDETGIRFGTAPLPSRAVKAYIIFSAGVSV